MSTRRLVLGIGLVGLVVAGLVGLVTYALWGSSSASAATVRAGDLDVALVGAARWTETSPDVTTPRTIVSVGGTADHRATAGDRLTLTQQFTVALDGDNLAARLDVRWDTPPTLLPASGVTATYVVTSPATAAAPQGVSTPPRTIGTAATLPSAPASFTPADVAAWAGRPWTLTVTLAYTGGSAVVVTPDRVATAPVTDLGTLVLDLRQVRDGAGFTS